VSCFVAIDPENGLQDCCVLHKGQGVGSTAIAHPYFCKVCKIDGTRPAVANSIHCVQGSLFNRSDFSQVVDQI
jgi:hypothetical protein